MLASASAMAASPTTSKTGAQVVDSKGAVVGNLVSQFQGAEAVGSKPVTRQINGVWMLLVGAVYRTGLATGGNIGPLYYTSSNCTGTSYLDASQVAPLAFLYDPANPNGASGDTTATIYYPTTLYQSLTIASTQFLGGPCSPISQQLDVGKAATTTLTVVPPLSIQ
jgi:hypothetical protein